MAKEHDGHHKGRHGGFLGGRRHPGHQGHGLGHRGHGKKIQGMSAHMGKRGGSDIEGPHEKEMAHK